MNQATLKQMAADPAVFQTELVIPGANGPARLGDIMADFQRDDFAALNPTLIALAKGEKLPIPRAWIERTKGGSKDSDAAVMMLWLLAFSPRQLRIQVGAYDASQADEIRLIIRSILRIDTPLNRLLDQVIDVQRSVIIGRNNESRMEILTTDSKGSHGSRPDVVLADELSHVGDEEFASTLFDNLDKMPRGFGLICTNAGHLQSWQHDWRNIAVESDRWHFSALTEPAPWISADDLAESRRRNSSSRYARLWSGQWVRDGGDALDIDDIEGCVVLDPPPVDHEPHWQDYFDGCTFIAGLDLSTKRDHSGLVVLAIDGKTRRVRLADVQSWAPVAGKVNLQAVRQGVLDAHKRFHFTVCLYDPHQAALMAQDLAEQRVPMKELAFTPASCNLMAQKIIETFRDRAIDLYRDEKLIGDLGRLMIVERGFGYKLEAVRDSQHGHADVAFSLAIALPEAIEIAQSQSTIPFKASMFTRPVMGFKF